MYLTGGRNRAATAASVYDLVRNQWEDAASLNHGRFNHTSICLGEKTYVIGGLGLDYDLIGSVESKGLSLDEPWNVVLSGKLRIPYSSISATVYEK